MNQINREKFQIQQNISVNYVILDVQHTIIIITKIENKLIIYLFR